MTQMQATESKSHPLSVNYFQLGLNYFWLSLKYFLLGLNYFWLSLKYFLLGLNYF